MTGLVANVQDGRVVKDKAKRCDHCANSGYLFMDHDDQAWPCPFCMIGAAHGAAAFWKEAQAKGIRIGDLTWDGGRTIRHKHCYQCEAWVLDLQHHHRVPVDGSDAECPVVRERQRAKLGAVS